MINLLAQAVEFPDVLLEQGLVAAIDQEIMPDMQLLLESRFRHTRRVQRISLRAGYGQAFHGSVMRMRRRIYIENADDDQRAEQHRHERHQPDLDADRTQPAQESVFDADDIAFFDMQVG